MILGIDIGTTAVKAILLDERARTIAEAEAQHNLHTPRPGWAEEVPEDWWQGAAAAARRVLEGRQPKAVGVSGMVPALVVLDASGRPLRLAIQQNDARATDEIRWFRERFPEDELFSRTGATWNAQVLPPKIRWLQQREPGVWANARRLCGSYEYVTWRFTGAAYAEANWALESGMWDARRCGWIPELLDLLELEPHLLMPARRPHEVVGTVTRDAHGATGIRTGTPVIAGSADHIATALTAGLRRRGDAVLEFGGAGNFLYALADFTPLRELFIDYHDLPDLFVLNGCMATSGSLAKWFRERFTPGKSYAELDREAEAVPPGSEGVVLLPYFMGEKTPLNDPDARGTIIGLTLAHTAPHLYRAILEGVAYAFRHHGTCCAEEDTRSRATTLWAAAPGARFGAGSRPRFWVRKSPTSQRGTPGALMGWHSSPGWLPACGVGRTSKCASKASPNRMNGPAASTPKHTACIVKPTGVSKISIRA